MSFLSGILDISSFFIILIMNLSLIALLCYYAKKKFESIEDIQKEQSKILFNLVNSSSGNNSKFYSITNTSIDPMFLSPSSFNASNENEAIKNNIETKKIILDEVDEDEYLKHIVERK